MKRLLMGSVALLLFSISILIFQFSCTKVSLAHDDDSGESKNTGKGKVVLYVEHNTQATSQARSLWLMDSDGSNRRKVNIVFPSVEYGISNGRLVDNGTKIIFTASKANESEQIDIMYKCGLDGSGLTELFRGVSYVDMYEVSDSY